jgi:hypothetical protein
MTTTVPDGFLEYLREALLRIDEGLVRIADVARGEIAVLESRETIDDELAQLLGEDDDVRTQRCRDCNETFPYDPDADICPECVRLMHPDREEDEDDG